MVFGVGANDEATTGSTPPSFNGGVVDDKGVYTPPAPRTPAQVEEARQAVSAFTNDSPVRMGLIPGRGRLPAAFETLPFYEAARFVNQVRGQSRATGSDDYKFLVQRLRAYTGQELGTDAAVDEAFKSLLQDAQSGKRTAMELLYGTGGAVQEDGGSGSSGVGSVGSYSGPVASVTVQAESDIRATADALALEMIGRPLNDRELERVTRRIRSAEQAQPTITTGATGARRTTQEGLTAQGRQDILREVIAERPEFESFQLDTTVMDAMNDYIQEKRAVVDV